MRSYSFQVLHTLDLRSIFSNFFESRPMDLTAADYPCLLFQLFFRLTDHQFLAKSTNSRLLPLSRYRRKLKLRPSL